MNVSPYIYWPLLILALTGVGIFLWDTLVDLSLRLFGKCDHQLMRTAVTPTYEIHRCRLCGRGFQMPVDYRYDNELDEPYNPTIPDDDGHEPKFKLIKGGKNV